VSAVGFVPCLPPGLHPGMDALALGLAQVLEDGGFDLRLFPADLRGGAAAIASGQTAAVDAALAAGMQAIVLFVLDAREPASAVARSLARGIPVVAIHKPAYPVSASVVIPNYYQGVVLAHALARALLPLAHRAPRVAILGGPEILDDVELVRGAVAGVRDCGLELVNDPFLECYRNLDDVRGGGKRAAARLLDEFHPFDGWVVFNDETALDALELLEERGLGGVVPTVSRNGSPFIVRELERGKTHATFDYQLPEIGMLAGQSVIQLLNGIEAPADALVTGPIGALITAANVAAYVPWQRRVREAKLVIGGT